MPFAFCLLSSAFCLLLFVLRLQVYCIKTYAVGTFSLRQSGTIYCICVRFYHTERGKTAHKECIEYLAAAGKKRRSTLLNNATAHVLAI